MIAHRQERDASATQLAAAWQPIIDALSANVAILDEAGVILTVNDNWRRFARENRGRPDACVGMNYFSTCELAAPQITDAGVVLHGLIDVLEDRRDSFMHHYQMAVGGEIRYYQLAASKVKLGPAVRLVVAHEDVSVAMRLQAQERERSLQKLTAQIEARRQIAGDLNETAGQHLAAMSLVLARLREQRPIDAGAEQLSELRALLSITQEEILTLSYLYFPMDSAVIGVRETVEQFVSSFSRRMGTNIGFNWHVQDLAELAGFEVVIFRMVQEGLKAVTRCPGDTAVSVTVESTNEAVTIKIDEDGFRTDGQPIERNDPRLSNMRSWAARLGGSLTLDLNDHGLQMLATLPRSASAAI